MRNVPVPATQKAIVTPEMGSTLNLVLSPVAVQDPAPGEAVLRILYSGICRSDASFSIGPQPGYPKHNHVAGHEGIGHVVKSHDPALLGRVCGLRYIGSICGSCTYCLRGLVTSCPLQKNIPKQIPGTFQQYVTVPSNCLIPIPEPLLTDDMDWALYTTALCSGSTALTSLRAARLHPDDVVIVLGIAGAIGHLTGAIAKHVLRARVIGIDFGSKIDLLSQDLDDYADVLLSMPEVDDEQTWSDFLAQLLQSCEKLRGGQGVSRMAESVIVSGSTFSAFRRLEQYVCDGGRIVCVGVPKGLNMLQIPLHAVVERNLVLTGNLMGGHQEALKVMGYIRSGWIKPKITKIDMEDIPHRMQGLVDCQTVGKVVARINEPVSFQSMGSD
ncbi:GroES-like protein [Aspergillus sclerotiicarbonarius CBS 121057]|uniref:GroES-like protein n=1 Tax=Aspergillus sclerotiicarbonarius (strain CBS 121057 / IBT 28362) TaxID=1448318 RepID=A0A319EUC7_ASPSB|nr:GroES-like protein [Aspergillus sclerotiicarbonarius CBS 121057]